MTEENNSTEYEILITDKHQLYKIYMPFIIDGGIFIKTSKAHELNSEVNFKLQLPDEQNPYKLTGRVVWVNPKFTQDGAPQGVGLQIISDNANEIHQKIESLLVGFISDRETPDTM